MPSSPRAAVPRCSAHPEPRCSQAGLAAFFVIELALRVAFALAPREEEEGACRRRLVLAADALAVLALAALAVTTLSLRAKGDDDDDDDGSIGMSGSDGSDGGDGDYDERSRVLLVLNSAALGGKLLCTLSQLRRHSAGSQRARTKECDLPLPLPAASFGVSSSHDREDGYSHERDADDDSGAARTPRPPSTGSRLTRGASPIAIRAEKV